LLALVHDLDAGGLGKQRASALGRQRLLQRQVDRLSVRTRHWHAHARRRDRQIGIREDLARFGHHFRFLAVIAVGADGGVVREDVERDLVRQRLRRCLASLERSFVCDCSSCIAARPAPLAD
jgi:hypothetical protein